MNKKQSTLYSGTLLHSMHTNDKISTEIIKNGAIAVENGKITFCGSFSQIENKDKYHHVDFGNRIICPTFVDTHLHMPQYKMLGAHGNGLLDWLNSSTFPEEIKMESPEYSQYIAKKLANSLLENGVASAMIFTATFKNSTEAMFHACEKNQMRAIIGKVSMDRNGPEKLLQNADADYHDQLELIQNWHGKNNKLFYALTPRFAPTSSEKQLEKIALLKESKPDLWLQTHHSENKDEIEYVKSLFPSSKNYLDVYDHYGLLGEKTVLAHSIHANKEELAKILETKTIISHCPSSNFFLGSGIMTLKKYFEMQIRLSLGSDIGAGTSLSPWKTMADSYKGQMIIGAQVSPELLFYLATLGGAKALGHDSIYGNFTLGHEADFQVINPDNVPLLREQNLNLSNPDRLLLPLIILGDDRLTERVYIQGNEVYSNMEV